MRSSIFTLMMLSILSVLTCNLFAVNGDLGLATQPLTDGSASYPFLIEDFADLQEFASDPNAYCLENTHIELMTDISIDPNIVYSKAIIAPDLNTVSNIDYKGTPFAGHFDGNGYCISNININASVGNTYVGLFGKISETGSVSDLTIENIAIGNSYRAGVLAVVNYGTITNCSSKGTVSGGDGLIYTNYGDVTGCFSSANVYGGCGLIGTNYGSVANCYFNGDKTDGCDLVYRNYGNISCCFTPDGMVHSNYDGGIISNCYSREIGSLVYKNYGTVSCCYCTGRVINGGFVGDVGSSSAIDNCYFYKFTCCDNGYGVALDDQQLQDKASFVGFDFTGDSSDGIDDFWVIEPGYMPRLYWQDSPGFEPPYFLDSISTTLTGTGYKDAPFIIDSIDDVNEFCSNPHLRSGYYELMIDVDSSKCYFSKDSFIGEFDGNGHSISSYSPSLFFNFSGTIKNLIVKDVMATGASGVIANENNGSIINCHVSGFIYSPDGINVSGLAQRNNGSIINCHVSGFIYAPDGINVGGLAQRNYGSIIDSSFEGCITGKTYVGAIAGENFGKITGCSASGDILGYAVIGGIVGVNNGGDISNCSSDVDIKGINSIGGLCGTNSGLVNTSCSSGDVAGRDENTGGLVGSNSGVISNCYSMGSVIGHENTGGGIGTLTGEIHNCYAAGSVSGWKNTGGMIGAGMVGDEAVSNCFWDIDKESLSTSDTDNFGAIGKTTTEMQDINTYLDAGWDLIIETDNGIEDIWAMEDYPVLSWQADFVLMPDLTNLSFSDAVDLLSDNGFVVGNISYDYSDTIPENLVIAQSYSAGSAVAVGVSVNLTLSFGTTQVLAGSGTESSPYLINDISDFYMFRNPDNDSLYWSEGVYVKLTCDLDLEGHTFISAPVSPDNDRVKSFFQGAQFNAVFDGDGHVIKNLTIDPDQLDCDYLGLFGELGPTALVQNLGLENFTIHAGIRSYNIGIICGKNCGGSIQNCYTAGTINCPEGSDYIGGICGYNAANGIIDSSCAAVTIIGGDYSQFIGGLCGENYGGNITYSFAVGNVSGENNIGGFCGSNSEGIIENCFATGKANGMGDSSSIGGFCGFNDFSGIYACYSTGIVSSEAATNLIGGFCGDSIESITESCFWDTQTSGQASSFGGTGCTSIQMQDMATFTDAGWDLSGSLPAGWYLPDGFYPVLTWQGCVVLPNTLEITLPEGGSAAVDLNLLSVSSHAVNWTVDTGSNCPWQTSFTPQAGTITALGQSQQVNVNIDSGSLPVGINESEIVVSLDHGADITIPVKINIVETVNMDEFALLSQYWLASGCSQAMPCSAADLNDDTIVDILDLTEFTNQWLLFNNIDNSFSEDFENINLQSSDFQFINSRWEVIAYLPYEGSYCLKSRSSAWQEPQRSIIYIDLDTTFCDNISFAVKTSTEETWDSLNFYIDDCLQGQWSGNLDWQLVSFPVTDGLHSFKWEFSQDYEGSWSYDENGQRIYKYVWIDNVKIQ